MRILAVGILSLLFGCSEPDQASRPEAKPDSESVHLAALNVVTDDFHVGSVWPGDSEFTINDMQARIDAARLWTSENVKERRVRNEYNGWLDFYERRVKEAREELRTHARQKRMEDYDREQKERWGKAREAQETLPRPARL